MNRRLIVSVVDDDESIRESLPELLRQMGFEVHVYACAEAFLASENLAGCQCLISDIAMPGMSGTMLVAHLKERNINIPIIIITANQKEQAHTQMIGTGIIACLYKPFSDDELSAALNAAIQASERINLDRASS